MKRKQDLLARRGLALSRRVLRRLDQVGIFVESQVSLEHQSLAKRYVVRGVESGGAIKELGRYVSFCAPDGGPLAYLHPIDAIGVNGLHAVVVAPVLVRIEVFRTGRTWQLLITRHEPAAVKNGRRPALESRILFRGVNGFLDERASAESGDPDGPLPGSGPELESHFRFPQSLLREFGQRLREPVAWFARTHITCRRRRP